MLVRLVNQLLLIVCWYVVRGKVIMLLLLAEVLMVHQVVLVGRRVVRQLVRSHW